MPDECCICNIPLSLTSKMRHAGSPIKLCDVCGEMGMAVMAQPGLVAAQAEYMLQCEQMRQIKELN